MKKTINYLWDFIHENLANGRQVAIPKMTIEKEGEDIDELGEYFHIKHDNHDLIHFLGFRNVL